MLELLIERLIERLIELLNLRPGFVANRLIESAHFIVCTCYVLGFFNRLYAIVDKELAAQTR